MSLVCEEAVISCLKQFGALTRREIARKTQYSESSVISAVTSLINQGKVCFKMCYECFHHLELINLSEIAWTDTIHVHCSPEDY